MKKKVIRKKLTLRRDLGYLQATVAGVGIILGAGIYALIGVAAGTAGNSVWLSFVLASIVAAFTGLSYAELSSIFPKDSGEFLYAEKAFGERIGFITGYLVIIAEVVAIATVALGFAGYFSSLLGINHLTLIAFLCIALFSFINFYGMKESTIINVIFTIIETFGLLFIIFLGIKYFGNVDYFQMNNGLRGIFKAASLIFFAYLGFDSMVKLSEETKNPKKTIPAALVSAIIITTVIYILVALAAISILGAEKLGNSNAPLADVAAAALGSKAFIMLAVIALFSTSNTVLVLLVTTSRLVYAMARDFKNKFLSRIHETRRTPYIAIILTGLLSLIFVMFGDISFVAGITDFAIFLVFLIVNLSLLVLRYKVKAKRGFTVPLNIGKFNILAFLGILSAVFMMFNLEAIVAIAAIGLALSGFVAYYIIKNFNNHKSFKRN